MLKNQAEYWDKIAGEWSAKHNPDRLLAEHSKKTHLGLLARWVDLTNRLRILKTDLFAEALNEPRQFLFDVATVNGNFIGIDISREIVRQAKRTARDYGVETGEYIRCDTRQLPLQTNSVDLIISDSTLDHFSDEMDIVVTLRELYRVLQVGGTLIVTMDNKSKLGEPLRRLWISLGLAPYFIGKTYSIKELKRVLQSIGFGVEDTTAIIHQPMFFMKLIVRLLHKLGTRRFDPLIRKVLVAQDTLEKRRTRYLTGLFIAAKAVKAL